LRAGVLAGLENRGVQGVLIACAGGLSGFPEAARPVCPDARVRLCAARTARNSTQFVAYKGLKKARAGLKGAYAAAAGEAGREALEGFGKTRNGKHPVIYRPWQLHWDGLGEFFKHPPEISRAIYATDAVEPLNCQLGKATKNRSAFSLMALCLRHCILRFATQVKSGRCRQGVGGRL
jgi:transposase-like protein